MDNSLIINTTSKVKKNIKTATFSPTVYSPASVITDIDKLLISNTDYEKIWKKSKLGKIKL